MKEKLAIAVDRLEKAVAEHKPHAVVLLLSGGHDSLSATYVGSQISVPTVVGNCNTGIGIEATRIFVRETCEEQGWTLIEKSGDSYEKLILKWGFPGPAGHGLMYQRLKERALRKIKRQVFGQSSVWTELFHAMCGVHPKIMWVSGCRSEESRRRMANTEEVQLRGNEIWCAPIHDWTKADTNALIEYAGLTRNPVVDLCGHSGECKCGAFAEPGELEEMGRHELTRPCYLQIKSLEAKVQAAGFPWNWGERPPKWFAEKQKGQTFLLDYDQPLCWNCNIQRQQLAEKLKAEVQP